MATTESMFLVQRAKAGEREALEALCTKYYPLWCAKFHATLGGDLRAICDTHDIVQSAMTQVVRDIHTLDIDGAFFAWACTIIRRKIGDKRKKIRGRTIPISQVAEPPDRGRPHEVVAEDDDDHNAFLDALLELYETKPHLAAAISLYYLEELDMDQLEEALGRPRDTLYKWLREGRRLLKSSKAGKLFLS